jgi:RNA polymerase sigma-70 factor (ECF subfamily)
MVGGDPTAWRTFVERFDRLVLTRVVTVARELNRSLNQADTEDLCADVFSQLVAGNYAALRRFEGRSTLSTWLCVVTRRIVLRRLSSHRGELAQPAPPLESLAGPAGDDPQLLAISDEDRELLATGIAQLNERQRRLAHLFYVDGCSYRDISQQLQMPINSVGPTLARIHEKLRAAMKTED